MTLSLEALVGSDGALVVSQRDKEVSASVGLTATPDIDLIFTYQSRARKYFHQVEIIFIFDGTRRVDKGSTIVQERRSSPIIDEVEEAYSRQTMKVSFTPAELRAAASAKSVELQIGPTEVVLDKTVMEALKRFIDCLESGWRKQK